MRTLSTVSKLVTPSPIRKMFNLSLGMDDVISFALGEPDFNTPDNVVSAAVIALKKGAHHYTPNAGILPLRQAISDTIEASHGIRYSPDQEVIVTAGGMEALMLTMMTILDIGDELILSDPCWTNYSRQALICSAKPVFVPVTAEHDFVFRPDLLEKAVTDKTKAFLLNSPSNPTGGIATRAELEKLAEIAVKHDLFVITDEVYDRIVFGNEKPVSIASLPGMKERTILINSFSKTFAMTGWRVGYAAGPSDVISNMVKLQENVAACVNTAAQYGALAALTEPQDAVDNMIHAYSVRRDIIVDGLSKIQGLTCFAPKGTFYVFVDIGESGMSATRFALDLLEKEKVLVVPGDAFGAESDHYIRLSFATDESAIREGVNRIRRYMSGIMGEKQQLTGRVSCSNI